MKKIPSVEECIELLQKQGCSEEVINHCKAVRDIAVNIAKRTNADIRLIEAGALLHDIGRAKTHGITHGIEGAKIAKKIGLPKSIIRIIECHIGAGIPKEEAVLLGLPKKDYIPSSLEEKIISHADNLTDSNKKQRIEKAVENAKSQGFEAFANRLIKMHNELSKICGIDLDDI